MLRECRLGELCEETDCPVEDVQELAFFYKRLKAANKRDAGEVANGTKHAEGIYRR